MTLKSRNRSRKTRLCGACYSLLWWYSAHGKARVGITAGASAPEVLVQAVIDKLKSLGATSVRDVEGIAERVTFPLPKALA